MAVTSDIVATYRGPGKVMSGLLAQGRNEVRVLMFALMAGLLIFVALSPYQARAAHLDPEGPLAVRQYWSAFFWIFVMPMLLYGLAAMVWAISRIAGQRLTGFRADPVVAGPRAWLYRAGRAGADRRRALVGRVLLVLDRRPACGTAGLRWTAPP